METKGSFAGRLSLARNDGDIGRIHETLWLRFRRELVERLASWRPRGVNDEEDLAHETIFKVATFLNETQRSMDERAVRAYLIAAARHQLIDAQRREAKASSADGYSLDMSDDEMDAESLAAMRESVDVIIGKLGELGEHATRLVLAHVLCAPASLKEICGALEISVGTAGGQMRRIAGQLKNIHPELRRIAGRRSHLATAAETPSPDAQDNETNRRPVASLDTAASKPLDVLIERFMRFFPAPSAISKCSPEAFEE